MVSTVSMVVTTIGRVVSNLVESGLVAFIGCWKDSGSDTLILVTRTCQPLLSLSMIKGCHSRLGDSHSVTDHWQDVFKKQFRAFLNVSSSPSVAPAPSARVLGSSPRDGAASGRAGGSRVRGSFQLSSHTERLAAPTAADSCPCRPPLAAPLISPIMTLLTHEF